MAKKPPAVLLLAILAVVILSGCVTGPTAPGVGAGIAILAFEPDTTEVNSGDNVQLSLQIQNQGASTAKDVKVRLFNIDPTEWQAGFARLQQDLGDMLGVQEDVPGQTEVLYWTLRAPTLPLGTKLTYNPIARIYYKYSTAAIQTISIVSEEEFRDLKYRGETLPIQSTVYTQGPLTVSVTNQPVRATDTWDRKWFQIGIHITNVGGGTLRAEPGWGWTPVVAGSELEYPVKVTIEMPSGLSLRGDCVDYEWGKYVSLFRNQDYDITCEVEITRVPEVREDKVIQIKLEYDYYITATTAVTVKSGI